VVIFGFVKKPEEFAHVFAIVKIVEKKMTRLFVEIPLFTRLIPFDGYVDGFHSPPRNIKKRTAGASKKKNKTRNNCPVKMPGHATGPQNNSTEISKI